MEENSNIPVGWHLKQVVEFASKMQSGGTPKSDNLEYYNGEIPFVAIDDLSKSNKYISKTQKKITNKGLINSSAWLVPKYSLLYSIYATLGVPRINLIEVATNQAILNIIPNKEIISLEFLYYLLLEKRNTILSHSAHTTQSNLNAKVVKELEFVFPKSTIEQDKIAEILSKVDKAISETEIIIAKHNRIKTGLMQDLLTKGIDEKGNIRNEETHDFKDSPLGRIPKDWDCLTIEKAKNLITSGSRGWAKYYSIEGSKFIRITNLKRNQIEIDLSDLKFVKLPSSIEGVRSRLQEGDLLISITADLGIIGVVSSTIGEAFVNQHISLVRLNQELVNSKFIGFFLSSSYGQAMFNLLNDGGAKAGLNLKTINTLFVLKPELDEQILIVEKIEKLNEAILKLRTEHTKLQSTKKGLMQDLLSGKKRVTHLIN